jgi:hypothetical protein
MSQESRPLCFGRFEEYERLPCDNCRYREECYDFTFAPYPY